jgi:hypothetical protein
LNYNNTDFENFKPPGVAAGADKLDSTLFSKKGQQKAKK